MLLWRRRRYLCEPVALGLMLLVPGLAFGLASVLAPTEDHGPPTLTNPDGTALQIDALPAGAQPVDVVFEQPIELLGGRLEGLDGDGFLRGELWFRVTGAVPRHVAPFVHIERDDGKLARQADHEVLGGTWFFANAPRGVILRDAFTVDVHGAPPGPWVLFAGLWNVTGDHQRVRMVSHAPGADVQGDRVRLGENVPSLRR